VTKKSEWQTSPIKSSRYAFTPEEIRKILEVAKQKNFRDYCLLLTLALTGRRVSEVVGTSVWEIEKYKKEPLHGLRVCDIDFANGVINWQIEKKFRKVKRKVGNETIEVIERVEVPIKAPKILLDTLKEYIERYIKPNCPNEKALQYSKLFPMTRFRVHQIVKKYVKLAGIKGRKRLVHAFRHGFAIGYLKKSSKPEDLLELKEQLQHSSVIITENYLRFLETRGSKILDEFANEMVR